MNIKNIYGGKKMDSVKQENILEYQIKEPKFKIGETVYIVYTHRAFLKNISNCKMCNGFGRIKIRGLSEPVCCPQCSIFSSSKHRLHYV